MTPRRAAAIGTPLVLVAGVTVAVWLAGSDDTTGSRSDIVAEAYTALIPKDSVAHTVVRSSLSSPGGGRPLRSRTEQWGTTRPLRYRIVIPDQSGPSGVFTDENGVPVGRQEIAYADGEQQVYRPGANTLTITTGLDDQEALAALGPGGADAMSNVRSLLEEGKLKDAGRARVSGRTVQRLVGSEATPDGAVTRRIVYHVDPETARPVGGTLTFKTPPAGPTTIRFTVDYERLPPTAASTRLLEITTNPGTRVIRRPARRARTTDP